jgi:hypothetical protein
MKSETSILNCDGIFSGETSVLTIKTFERNLYKIIAHIDLYRRSNIIDVVMNILAVSLVSKIFVVKFQ